MWVIIRPRMWAPIWLRMWASIRNKVAIYTSSWKINLSFLLRGDRGISEIHVIQKERAGRSKYGLGVRDTAWTFDILAGCSKYSLDVRSIGRTVGKMNMEIGAWGSKTGFQNFLLKQNWCFKYQYSYSGSNISHIIEKLLKKCQDKFFVIFFPMSCFFFDYWRFSGFRTFGWKFRLPPFLFS